MECVIKKVKIDSGEPLKGRVIKILSKTGSFEAPTKVPTSTELNGKKNIGFDAPFLNPVFEITQKYTDKNVSSLHEKNGVHARKVQEINAHADTLINRSLVKYFPQFPRNVVLSDNDVRSFIDLQCESNLNIISLPEIRNESSIDEFKSNFMRYWEYVSDINPNAVFMPYINLSQSPELFREKLNYLSNFEGALHGIGVKFASLREFRPNLFNLANFSDKAFWIHCSTGKRANWTSDIPSGQLHILQRYGVDTVSVEIPMYGGSSKVKPVSNTRYFNSEKITIPKISESLHDGELTCNCPICRQQKFNEVVEDLNRYVTQNKSINSVLNDFSKIHEVYASTKEFEISRKSIKEGELRKYFHEKVGLRDDLENSKEYQSILN